MIIYIYINKSIKFEFIFIFFRFFLPNRFLISKINISIENIFLLLHIFLPQTLFKFNFNFTTLPKSANNLPTNTINFQCYFQPYKNIGVGFLLKQVSHKDIIAIGYSIDFSTFYFLFYYVYLRQFFLCILK